MDGNRGPGPRRAFPFAVAAIVAINLVVFAQESTIARGFDRDAFIDGYALIPYDLTHLVQPQGFPVPTIATLVTSQFLHGSVLHVVSNMLLFALFATQIEALLGHVKFALFYLTCGVVGGLAQVSMSLSSHVPIIGASGAIAGILGAFVIRHPSQWPAFIVIVAWVIVQCLHGFGSVSLHVLSEQGGGTAYFAHIGGFAAGVLLFNAFAGRVRPVADASRSSYDSR